jgi:hypothetical protein
MLSDVVHLWTRAGIRAVIAFLRRSISGVRVFFISTRKVERTEFMSGKEVGWENSLRGEAGLKVGIGSHQSRPVAVL